MIKTGRFILTTGVQKANRITPKQGRQCTGT